MEHVGNLYMGDFFFFPAGTQEKDFLPIVIDTESISIPCFSLPSPELGKGPKISGNLPITLPISLTSTKAILYRYQTLDTSAFCQFYVGHSFPGTPAKYRFYKLVCEI